MSIRVHVEKTTVVDKRWLTALIRELRVEQTFFKHFRFWSNDKKQLKNVALLGVLVLKLYCQVGYVYAEKPDCIKQHTWEVRMVCIALNWSFWYYTLVHIPVKNLC